MKDNQNTQRGGQDTQGDRPEDAGARLSRTSLTVRIAAMLTLALLPLGLIAVFQSLQAIDAAREVHRNSLSAQTFRAASPEDDAIVSALGIARGLAIAMPSLLSVPDECVAAMQRATEENRRLSFAGFVDSRRISVCNSADLSFNFSENGRSAQVFEAGVRDVSFTPSGASSELAVVIVSEPVLSDEGGLLGFVSLSFPAKPLVEARAEAGVDEAVTLVTFGKGGEILTSDLPREEVEAVLPANIELKDLVGTPQRVFSGPDKDGREREYALIPLVDDLAYALGSWDAARPIGQGNVAFMGSVLFPLVMWLASLLVAVLALRRLVILPVRRLRMRMRGFADGRRLIRAEGNAAAPRELHEIGLTFERMAQRIIHDEAELEDKVHERDVLLREVHHRVKNNLQLMSSIINMQIRQSRSKEAEGALRRVQGRLASLAKFHQDLYEASSLAQLRADQLLEDLARQMVSMSAEPMKQIDLRLEMEQMVLSPDQASPLAMLVTEALTNALKYSDADAGTPKYIRLSLARDQTAEDDTVLCEVENSLTTAGPKPMVKGLGTRLMSAFASQLEAALDHEQESGRYLVRVRFRRHAQEQYEQGT